MWILPLMLEHSRAGIHFSCGFCLQKKGSLYIAVVSGVPSTLHPGACVLVVGRQSSPIFALYWDQKLQFPLQGGTALWDSILLLSHRIKVGYRSIFRGMHLGSSALSILPILESENED